MNILTFDIEDWYHNLIRGEIKDRNYSVLEKLEQLLLLFEKNKVRPTFFVVSSFAQKHPELIKKIAKQYDIGSHGHKHDVVNSMSLKEFEKDIKQSIEILEDITGNKIIKYRAPGFSIPDKSYFDVIAATQIEIDSSLSAVNHFYGKKILEQDKFCLINCKNKLIKEFPPSVIRVFGRKAGFLGGGYFRLLPSFLLEKQISNRDDYALLYLHANDFDTNIPKIQGISPVEQFRRRVGIKHSEQKLLKLVNKFHFVDIASAVAMTDWSKVEVRDLR